MNRDIRRRAGQIASLAVVQAVGIADLRTRRSESMKEMDQRRRDCQQAETDLELAEAAWTGLVGQRAGFNVDMATRLGQAVLSCDQLRLDAEQALMDSQSRDDALRARLGEAQAVSQQTQNNLKSTRKRIEQLTQAATERALEDRTARLWWEGRP